jgi:DNA-binding NtrC family response regulator
LIELAKVAGVTKGIAEVRGAETVTEAFELLSSECFDLILLDLSLSDKSGPIFLSEVLAAGREALVVVITSDTRSDTIVECMKRGSYDYATKPIDMARIETIFTHALRRIKLQREVRMLRDQEYDRPKAPAFEGVITRSPLMFVLFRAAEQIAPSPLAALVAGESGVGKELFAEALHLMSGRSGSFVPVNVAGLDDALLSDTLFGHLKGAYTGAQDQRGGLVREAENGTLFLDEIGDIGIDTQIKLLRFLQNGEYYPLGSDRPERSTARLVMATNADLQAKVNSGSFRADLYYRLMIHHLVIPPLRERREDIPLLVDYFARGAAKTLNRSVPKRLDRFLQAIDAWDFPGNVRELFALVHSAMSASDGMELSVDFVHQYFAMNLSIKAQQQSPSSRPGGFNGDGSVITSKGRFLTLQEVEERQIREAIRRSGGNQAEASRLLGVSQATISRRIKQLSLKE